MESALHLQVQLVYVLQGIKGIENKSFNCTYNHIQLTLVDIRVVLVHTTMPKIQQSLETVGYKFFIIIFTCTHTVL